MTRATLATALALILAAPAALAVTADEVWADWQRLARDGGTSITARTDRAGDRLVLTDIVIPIGAPGARADLKIPRVELQDRPDGTVAVLLPERFSVVIDDQMPDTSGPDVVTFAASAPGFAMTIAGLGDTAAFEITAPSLVLSVERINPPLPPGQEFAATLALADLALSHRMDLTQPVVTASSSLALGTLHSDLLIDVDAPERVTLSWDLSGLSGALDLVLPPAAQGQMPDPARPSLTNILDALADGLRIQADLSFADFALMAETTGTGEDALIDMTSTNGKAGTVFDPARAGYDLALGPTRMTVRGDMPDIALSEISLGFENLAYAISLGLGDLTQPQEARFIARLVDFELPAEIFAAVDPSGALALSPMTFALDIAGRYALSPQMLAPDWQPEPGVFPPMDLVDVTLTELAIAIAGVTLDGRGSLTFDESDLETFGGLPAPEGTASFQASGVDALIDRLIAAGYVQSSDLMPLRMALMAIAKAGEAPDTLTSEIEFRDKSLIVNGQKIR
jgi:hypothetical protein